MKQIGMSEESMFQARSMHGYLPAMSKTVLLKFRAANC